MSNADYQTCTNRDLEVVRKLQGLVVLIDEVHLLNYKDHGMCWRLNSMNDEGFGERFYVCGSYEQ